MLLWFLTSARPIPRSVTQTFIFKDDPPSLVPSDAVNELFDELATHLAINTVDVLGEDPVTYLGCVLPRFDNMLVDCCSFGKAVGANLLARRQHVLMSACQVPRMHSTRSYTSCIDDGVAKLHLHSQHVEGTTMVQR